MISVCMATHNGERYIKNQIDSILAQIGDKDELIISDDGSNDRTVSIIKSYNDARIKLLSFQQPKNSKSGSQKGFVYASRNFEHSLNYAKGDYIFLSDQDDIWYPDKIIKMLSALKTNDIVKHNLSIIDENGLIEKEYFYDSQQQRKRNWFHLIKYLPFRGCCLGFRRWVLEASLPFPDRCLQHDSWIGIVARYKTARFFYIEDPLIYHRIHSDNASELLVPNSFMYKVSYRLTLLLQLFQRVIKNKFVRSKLSKGSYYN